MAIHVLLAWRMVLNHRFVIFPEQLFDPTHFLPGRATVIFCRVALHARRHVLPSFTRPLFVAISDDNDESDLSIRYKKGAEMISFFGGQGGAGLGVSKAFEVAKVGSHRFLKV